MATMTEHEVQPLTPPPTGWRAIPTEMWAAISIVVVWLAVLFDGIYGPDLNSSNVGGDSASVPSVLIVAFFACLATVSIAKHGFARGSRS